VIKSNTWEEGEDGKMHYFETGEEISHLRTWPEKDTSDVK